MIGHTPEFTGGGKPQQNQAAQDLAVSYFRLFSTPDGKVVLKSLLKDFDPMSSRFNDAKTNPGFDPIRAAWLDGQRTFLAAILKAIDAGDPTKSKSQ